MRTPADNDRDQSVDTQYQERDEQYDLGQQMLRDDSNENRESHGQSISLPFLLRHSFSDCFQVDTL